MANLEKVIKGFECCRDGFCNLCPYDNITDESCRQSLEDDALALLKAQQPRVLTLKEATGVDECCWLECNNGSCGNVDFIMMPDGTVHLWRCFADKPTVMNCATYGREWRCWSARPTDERRKAAKWNE